MSSGCIKKMGSLLHFGLGLFVGVVVVEEDDEEEDEEEDAAEVVLFVDPLSTVTRDL